MLQFDLPTLNASAAIATHTGERIPSGILHFISLSNNQAGQRHLAALVGLSVCVCEKSGKPIGADSAEKRANVSIYGFHCDLQEKCRLPTVDCRTNTVFQGKLCNACNKYCNTQQSSTFQFNTIPSPWLQGQGKRKLAKNGENGGKPARNKKQIENLNVARTMLLRQFQRFIAA